MKKVGVTVSEATITLLPCFPIVINQLLAMHQNTYLLFLLIEVAMDSSWNDLHDGEGISKSLKF